MTYAMTWERDYRSYKYETIQQDKYLEELDDEPLDELAYLGHEVISLDEMTEDELEEEGLI
jgi:hypothetical protein